MGRRVLAHDLWRKRCRMWKRKADSLASPATNHHLLDDKQRESNMLELRSGREKRVCLQDERNYKGVQTAGDHSS